MAACACSCCARAANGESIGRVAPCAPCLAAVAVAVAETWAREDADAESGSAEDDVDDAATAANISAAALRPVVVDGRAGTCTGAAVAHF